jgi:copper chaperone NosL
MTLVDTKFGAEIVTKKGKVYKFDDANCMINFFNGSGLDEREIAFRLIVDYTQPGKLIEANQAFYLKSDIIHSPMNSQIAAFESYETLEKHKKKWNAIYLSWGELVTQFK